MKGRRRRPRILLGNSAFPRHPRDLQRPPRSPNAWPVFPGAGVSPRSYSAAAVAAAAAAAADGLLPLPCAPQTSPGPQHPLPLRVVSPPRTQTYSTSPPWLMTRVRRLLLLVVQLNMIRRVQTAAAGEWTRSSTSLRGRNSREHWAPMIGRQTLSRQLFPSESRQAPLAVQGFSPSRTMAAAAAAVPDAGRLRGRIENTLGSGLLWSR